MHFVPVDHDIMNDKDAEATTTLSVTDRLKSVFGGLTAKKMNVGGHEQDNHDEVSVTAVSLF